MSQLHDNRENCDEDQGRWLKAPERLSYTTQHTQHNTQGEQPQTTWDHTRPGASEGLCCVRNLPFQSGHNWVTILLFRSHSQFSGCHGNHFGTFIFKIKTKTAQSKLKRVSLVTFSLLRSWFKVNKNSNNILSVATKSWCLGTDVATTFKSYCWAPFDVRWMD